MGKGETIPGMLEGVPWGQLPLLWFVPGVKPAKGDLGGYLQPQTPLPQPRASVSPLKEEHFSPGVGSMMGL